MPANEQHSTIQCIIHDHINTAKSSEPVAVVVPSTTTCQELIDRIKTQFVSISVFVYTVVGSDCVGIINHFRLSLLILLVSLVLFFFISILKSHITSWHFPYYGFINLFFIDYWQNEQSIN